MVAQQHYQRLKHLYADAPAENATGPEGWHLFRSKYGRMRREVDAPSEMFELFRPIGSHSFLLVW